MSENRKEILAEGFLTEGQKNEKQESEGRTVSETDIKSMTLPELEAYLQLLPGVHGTDGFFIARFRRK